MAPEEVRPGILHADLALLFSVGFFLLPSRSGSEDLRIWEQV